MIIDFFSHGLRSVKIEKELEKITSLTCTPLQICIGVGDLKKQHYKSNASDKGHELI